MESTRIYQQESGCFKVLNTNEASIVLPNTISALICTLQIETITDKNRAAKKTIGIVKDCGVNQLEAKTKRLSILYTKAQETLRIDL